MVRLSGDHVTSLSDDFVWVICRGAALPSAGTSQRSELWSFSSYAGSVTEKTTHLPSGLGRGLLTLFMSQSISCVGAFFAAIPTFLACAEASEAAMTSRARAAARMRFMGEMVTQDFHAAMGGSRREAGGRSTTETLRARRALGVFCTIHVCD